MSLAAALNITGEYTGEYTVKNKVKNKRRCKIVIGKIVDKNLHREYARVRCNDKINISEMVGKSM